MSVRGRSEAIDRKGTNNAMAKRKRDKGSRKCLENTVHNTKD